MSDFDHLHLRRLDVTLLLVFAEAMRTRKLGVVAERLGLTRSAVSHAVGRLRAVFDDPLFLRRATGVEPTPRALELAPEIESALAALGRAVADSRRFDPSRLTRTFTVAALDAVVATLMPPLLDRLAAQAPQARLAMSTLPKADALERLGQGRLDIAVGVYGALPPGFARKPLGRERFVTIARHGHPALGDGLDLDAFCAADHLLVSPGGDLTGPVDDALAALGRSRRVVAAVPQFLAVFAAVAATDAIASVPAGLAAAHAGRFGLAIHPTPLPVPPFEVEAIRGPLGAGDPAVGWLLDGLAESQPAAGG